MALQDQGGHAGHDSGGHGGAAEAEVLVVDDPVRVVLVQDAVGLGYGDDVAPGRHQLRLGEAVLGGAPAGPGGEDIVVEGGGPLVVEGTYGHDEGVVAGAVADGVWDVTDVAGGRYHEDAAEPEELGCRTQGVHLVALGHRRGQGEVDHSDVEGVLVVVDKLQAGHNVGQGGVPLLVGHLHVEQVSTRGDADVLAFHQVAVAADDAGDVGAVAEAVGDVGGVGIDHHFGDDPLTTIGILEVLVAAG